MDKEMMLEAVDIIRTVASRQKGFKRRIGKALNRLCYVYYKWIKER
jgi:hypothetical protein